METTLSSRNTTFLSELRSLRAPGLPLEKDAQSVILQKLNERRQYSHKLTDASMGYKPYDFLFLDTDAITYHCELKHFDYISKHFEDELFLSLRPNQKKSLSTISKVNPDIALVIAYIKDTGVFLIYRYIDIANQESPI